MASRPTDLERYHRAMARGILLILTVTQWLLISVTLIGLVLGTQAVLLLMHHYP